jgi:phage/plasmid primase-like uncharacterized protein
MNAALLEHARAVPIEEEIARRSIKLRGRTELVGPCPICGGTDRFSINARKQVWNCRGCQCGGDAIALVQHFDGCTFREAVETLSGESRIRPQALRKPYQAQTSDDEIKRTQQALAIWSEARDPRGTIVEAYLERRGLMLPEEAAGGAIRFHLSCPFGGARTPAMVALVRDVATDEPKAIHRTAITPDGRKAKVEGGSRMSLGPVGGGAVKLTPDENVTLCLGIGEGIESTLSVRLAPEFGDSPVWALLSAGQVAAFPALAGVETLWIAVDHDGAGIKAARECGRRWRSAGCEVFLVTPRIGRADLNDLVKAA